MDNADNALNVTTERLIIRRMAPTDLLDLIAYQTHPANLLYQSVEPFTEDRAAKFLARQSELDFDTAEGWLAFAVEHRADHRLIGEVGVFIQPADQDSGDIGWAFHPDYHGHGYATEAARILLDFVFLRRNLHRVTASCDTRNTPSVRLMERLGLRREAHFRQNRHIHDTWQDEYIYALLRDEYHSEK